mgnify:CR=1 FL=1
MKNELTEIRNRLADVKRARKGGDEQNVEAVIQWLDALHADQHTRMIPIPSAVLREVTDAWAKYRETGFDEDLIEAMRRLDENTPFL